MFTFSKACNFFCSLGTNFLSWGGRVKKDSNWKIHDKKKQIKSRSPTYDQAIYQIRGGYSVTHTECSPRQIIQGKANNTQGM